MTVPYAFRAFVRRRPLSAALLSGVLLGASLAPVRLDAAEIHSPRGIRARNQSLFAGAPRVVRFQGGDRVPAAPSPLDSSVPLLDGSAPVASGECPYFPSASPHVVRPASGVDPVRVPMLDRFAGGCYGHCWRAHQRDCATGSSRFHYPGRARQFLGGLFGKWPRTYVHNTAGEGFSSHYVTQPLDPAIAAIPEAPSPFFCYHPPLYGYLYGY